MANQQTLPPIVAVFVDDVLRDLGITPDAINTEAFGLWLENEQGKGWMSFDANRGNPLGIQNPAAQAAGAKGSMFDGAKATAQLLRESYTGIVDALRASKSVEDIVTAIVNPDPVSGLSWNKNYYGGLGVQGFMNPGSGAGGASVVSQNPTPSPPPVEQPLKSGGGTVTPPAYETQGMNQQYNGPGAYKGFDLQGITDPTELAETKRAIDAFTSKPGLEQQILSNIFKEFPQDAWMATIPEIRTILLSAVYNNWPQNQIKGAVAGTNWYKSTAPSIRYWESVSATDPAEAQNAVSQAGAQVTNLANTLGVQLTEAQVQQIARTVASQSFDSQGNYVNGLMPEQSILAMIESTIGQTPGAAVAGAYTPPGMPGQSGAGSWVAPGGAAAAQAALQADQAALNQANHTLAAATAAYRKHKDPETEAAVKAAQRGVIAAHTKVQQAQALAAQVGSAQPSPAGAGSSSPGAPGAAGAPGQGGGGFVTGSSGGDSQSLYNAFTTIARNYYLNMSPQQIQSAVDRYLKGDTGQGNFMSGAVAGFTTEAQTQAKALYPALSSILGTTSSSGTDNTPYAALSGYRSLIAQYTGYQGDPDTIDLTSPQWSWILSGKTPPSASGAIAGATGQGSSQSGSQTPTLPSYDQVQQYLMGTPQFQSTDLAKQLGWHVAKAITSSFGF